MVSRTLTGLWPTQPSPRVVDSILADPARSGLVLYPPAVSRRALAEVRAGAIARFSATPITLPLRGQRQRVAIARALILDSVDPAARRADRSSLESRSGGSSTCSTSARRAWPHPSCWSATTSRSSPISATGSPSCARARSSITLDLEHAAPAASLTTPIPEHCCAQARFDAGPGRASR